MTAQEVLKVMAGMSEEDLLAVQSGIAEMMAARFSPGDIAEINHALDEADAEFARGEGMSSAALRKQLGVK
jgi:hypothetical protein